MIPILFVLALLANSCTDEGRSHATLTSAGYTNIEVGGYDMFKCGEDDAYATKFVATNPAGQQVSGTVCCGGMGCGKGCTIRF
jgi:hypothetical protein